MSAMVEVGGIEPRQVLCDSLMPFAALAFARFPEVMMALGNPSLAREFDLPPARSACTVIKETADCKLVQVVLRRAGASRSLTPEASVHCATDIDHQQADRVLQGRSAAGEPACHTHPSPPMIGGNEVQPVIQALNLPSQRESFVPAGIRDQQGQLSDSAAANGVNRDVHRYVMSRCMESTARNQNVPTGPASLNPRPTLEAWPSAWAVATENVEDTGKSDRGSDSNALDQQHGGSAARHLYLVADRASTDASSNKTGMASTTSVGNACPLAEEPLAKEEAPFAHITLEKFSPGADVFSAGGSAQLDGNSASRNESLRQVEAPAPNECMTQVRDAIPASAATAPRGQTQPLKKKKRRDCRKTSLSSLEEEGFEPASPRSPGSYRPWGRRPPSKACRKGTPVKSQCDQA